MYVSRGLVCSPDRSQCMRVCHNCHGWSDPGSWRWYSLSESTWEALKLPNFSGEACSHTPLVASAFSTEVLANEVCPCCALASAVFWVWWHCLLGAQIFSPPYFLWQAERKSVIPYVHFELELSPPYQCWTHVLNLLYALHANFVWHCSGFYVWEVLLPIKGQSYLASNHCP